MNLERIDAHHHLWRYTPEEFDWLAEPGFAPLRQDFLLPALREAVLEAAIAGTVAVQARQTVEETRWLLALAAESAAGDGKPLIRGVVGWTRLRSRDAAAVIEELREAPLLKGLRHVVQAEPAGFLEDVAFNRGVGAMAGTGLVYDVLITEAQIGEATQFVDRHPAQSFVLDHVAKPKIAAGVMEPWATAVRELARRDNVCCKLSGMVTEAEWTTWTPEGLRPYLDVVVEAFGPERLMAGSDWPVCLVASGYGRWWRVLTEYFAGFSAAEQAAVFGGVAARVYGL